MERFIIRRPGRRQHVMAHSRTAEYVCLRHSRAARLGKELVAVNDYTRSGLGIFTDREYGNAEN